MKDIRRTFLRYSDITFWAEKHAINNDCKVSIRLVDHKQHKEITINDVNRMLYNVGLPSYRNAYLLRIYNKEKAVFFLAVKGFSVALICDFIYKPNIINGLKEELNGQLSFDI